MENVRRQYVLPDIKDCEFFALSPQNSAILVKNGDKQIDVLDGDTLDLAFSMKVDQPKCVYLAQKLIFVGTWNCVLNIYDVGKDFKLIKTLKTKAGVRTICEFDRHHIVCGENEGWVDVIRFS